MKISYHVENNLDFAILEILLIFAEKYLNIGQNLDLTPDP